MIQRATSGSVRATVQRPGRWRTAYAEQVGALIEALVRDPRWRRAWRHALEDHGPFEGKEADEAIGRAFGSERPAAEDAKALPEIAETAREVETDPDAPDARTIDPETGLPWDNFGGDRHGRKVN